MTCVYDVLMPPPLSAVSVCMTCVLMPSPLSAVSVSREPGWLEGVLEGKKGLIPENYVEML